MATVEQEIARLDRNDVEGAIKVWRQIDAERDAGKRTDDDAEGARENLFMLQDDPTDLIEAIDKLKA